MPASKAQACPVLRELILFPNNVGAQPAVLLHLVDVWLGLRRGRRFTPGRFETKACEPRIVCRSYEDSHLNSLQLIGLERALNFAGTGGGKRAVVLLSPDQILSDQLLPPHLRSVEEKPHKRACVQHEVLQC